MHLSHILPFAALATTFVIPEEQVANQLVIEPKKAGGFLDELPSKDAVFDKFDRSFSKAIQSSKNILDEAISLASETGEKATHQFHDLRSNKAFDVQSWLDTALDSEPLAAFGGHGHHGHHDHKPNMTVYQLIGSSKYTTRLAELINEDEDLVRVLNSTSANYTVFAPIDKAFERIPEHGKKPSKEMIKKALLYHVSPDFYPAGRVLVTHTIPTLVKEPGLQDQPQRLRVGLGFKGLAVNFYSRIIAINIFGTNGVIHGVDHLLIPPPTTPEIIELLPGEFSTLELGLEKTGLAKDFKSTPSVGGTLFAPSNFAFQKLGPGINAFLFSSRGLKYLKGLLKYHVVPKQTLYSDAYYPDKESTKTDLPKGLYHIDLPTLLEDRALSVDVFRYGGFISIKINGFTTVTVQDGIAKDGVIHVISDVLVPPKKLGGEAWTGEELTVEELKERLEPYIPYTEEKGDITSCGVPVSYDASEEFKDKKVVLFSVPGYIAALPTLKKKGVDIVAVIAYNDAFVMSAWGKANNIKDEIIFLSDPSIKFSSSLGWTKGERTARYAMIIDHGKVTYAEKEPGGDVTVSGAEAVLERLG
ncbi:MAG: hypothetical protein M1817_003770 [Caeruleum heppii]|nr:MAG: hypothetical protein M1817_003770 [Caeruleum heppii]